MSATRAPAAPPARSRLIAILSAVALAAAVLTPLTLATPGTAEAAPFTPGAQTRFPLPDHDAKPGAIVTGIDGAMYIAETGAGAIVRMTPDGATTRHPIPSGAGPTRLAVKNDGSVWWVAEGSHAFGALVGGVVTEWTSTPGNEPTDVALDSAGDTWFTFRGAPYSVLRMRGTDTTTITEMGGDFGLTDPNDITWNVDSLWISEPVSNRVLVVWPSGGLRARIDIPSPSLTANDGDLTYVVSADSQVARYSLHGAYFDVISDRDDFPLISGLVLPTRGELWTSQLRGKRVTVTNTTPGVPPADLLVGSAVSDVAIGPDGALWGTLSTTSEVVRIARDWVPGGIRNPGSNPEPLRAYVGEPVGPFSLTNRGSGEVTVTLNKPLPSGLRIDPSRPDTVIGAPDGAGTSTISVALSNTYYGGGIASVSYERPLMVRDRPAVVRLGGVDRYEVAARASRDTYPGGAATVYLASGERFPDALSAGPMAIADDAPLLLSTAKTLPAPTRDEITRLNPSTIILVGGPAALSDEVLAAISRTAKPGTSIQRIGGADRYEVSRNLAARADLSAHTLYLATGANYPDALSAGPLSRFTNAPVLLVDGAAETLPDSILRFILDHTITRFTITGGTKAVSAGIEAQLTAAGKSVTRLGGVDRYAASVAMNRGVLRINDNHAGARVDDPIPLVQISTVYLASGAAFPDALAGGAAAGHVNGPLYIVHPDCVPRNVLVDIGSTAAQRVVILGGTKALSPAVEALTPCP